MRTLRLVALSDDGSRIVLAADVLDPGDPGERFELVVDDRLRAAARGDVTRMGKLEVDLSTELPPRLIQARIRAGETPEEVSESSGSKLDRVLRFASPVLQERARVAEQARGARVRLSEGVIAGSLHTFMAERLRLLGADLDAVRWDAHRTDDGTWQVDAAWRSGHTSGTTIWNYDLPARTVTPVDAATMDFAEGTRLVRVVPDVPVAPAPTADVVEVAPPPAEATQDAPDDDDLHDTVVIGRVGDGSLDDPAPDGEASDPRAAVPAWEDIVFGVRRHR